jgi:sorting nexin-1/2
MLTLMLCTVIQADRRALDAHSDFDAVSRLVKMEFSRYEQERVEEFKHMFERYLDEMIVAQKEVGHCFKSTFPSDSVG